MFVFLFSLGFSNLFDCCFLFYLWFTYDLPITYQECDKCSCSLAISFWLQLVHFGGLTQVIGLLDFLTGITEITCFFVCFFYLSNTPLCRLSGLQAYIIIYFLFSDFLSFQSMSQSLTSSLSHSQYYSLKMPVLAYLGVESLF